MLISYIIVNLRPDSPHDVKHSRYACEETKVENHVLSLASSAAIDKNPRQIPGLRKNTADVLETGLLMLNQLAPGALW